MVCSPGRTIALLVVILSTISPVPGEELSIELGGRSGWAGITSMDNVITTQGFGGYDSLTLEHGEYPPRDGDVILHFNSLPLIPEHLVRFAQQSSSGVSPRLTDSSAFLGDGAVLFAFGSGGISWQPAEGEPLSADREPGTFSLEFWLNPARVTDGEEIFLWEGLHTITEQNHTQKIRATFREQRMEWHFQGIFQTPAGESTEFTVGAVDRLFPKRWNHHLVRYDGALGLLEYLVNGIPQGVVHTTSSGSESGALYHPKFGSARTPRIVIGGDYLGLLDEFRITERFVRSPQLTRYTQREGYASTRVMDLQQPGARFLRIEEVAENDHGELEFTFRQDDTPFLDGSSELEWNVLAPGGQPIDESYGRYLQLRIKLLPDGDGAHSPQLSSLKILYELALPPLPPTDVVATPGDGRVTLRWNGLGSGSADGYRIYFGEMPGVYLGSDSIQSPIDVADTEEYTLDGLENGKAYYFSMTSYGGYKGLLNSSFSDEYTARPGRALGEPGREDS